MEKIQKVAILLMDGKSEKELGKNAFERQE
jgi:hypothetical protein